MRSRARLSGGQLLIADYESVDPYSSACNPRWLYVDPRYLKGICNRLGGRSRLCAPSP